MKTKKENATPGVKCPYLSTTFLKLFDCYAEEHFKDAKTKTEYWENICYLCNYAKTDFLQSVSYTHLRPSLERIAVKQ